MNIHPNHQPVEGLPGLPGMTHADLPGTGLEELQEHLEGRIGTPEAEVLQAMILEVIERDNPVVKSLSSFSKKQLAREVLRLQSIIKVIKSATSIARPGINFQHAEAFSLMRYVEDGTGDPAAPSVVYIWNARDGVTPFTVHIRGRRYSHDVAAMTGPHFFDEPDKAQFKWVTRSPVLMMEAWHRVLEKMVAAGKFTREKADHIWDNQETAASWNYNIGLVDTATGRFTDEDEVTNAAE